MAVNVPDAGAPLVGPDGLITPAWYPVIRLLIDQANAAEADIADGDTGLSSKADKDQTDSFYGLILVPQNQAYNLVLKLAYGVTITETTTRCTSGTCTATFSINGVPLGGAVNSVSTSEQSQAHASANVALVDQDLAITVSANAACLNLSLTIKYTYDLV